MTDWNQHRAMLGESDAISADIRAIPDHGDQWCGCDLCDEWAEAQDRIAATETDIDHYIRTCSPIMIEAEK